MLFQGSYPSTLHHKCNAVPGGLLSKFTTSEKPYIWSWLCDANVKKTKTKKKCPMAKVFRGHNIVLSKEPVGKELWEEINRKYQEHSAWGKAKEILISNVTLKMSSITTIYWCIKIDHDGNCTNQSVKVTDSDSTNPDVVKRDPVPETQHHRNSHTNSH